jgi:sec-independent protein translocase protein TatA
MLGGMGPMEIGVIVLIALLLFGAGRIASVGKGLGQSVKNFRDAVRDEEGDDAESG